MAQLLVRNVEDSLVRKLKRRAKERGVSAEEEHRRILAESLARNEKKRPSLIGFLMSDEGTVAPEIELELTRTRRLESRNTGF